MNLTLKQTAAAAALGSLVVLCACANEQPNVQPQANVPMQQEQVLGRTAMVYRAPNVDARKYTKFMIDPVQIYRGSDAQWSGASPEQVQQLAMFLRSEMIRALGDRYPVVTTPGPDVARIELTLAGLEDNVPVAATVSRIAPAGLAVSIVKQAADKPGTFSGSVTLTGEIVDSRTNQPLIVFAQKRYPDALDIGSTFSSTDAQRTAITSFADAFRKRLDTVQQQAAGR